MADAPRIAAFRPAGDRAEAARRVIEDLGATPLVDPMLEPAPTGALPREDAAWTVFTSVTAADLLADAGWRPTGTTVAAIGPKTADALAAVAIDVALVPDRYTSDGLVSALADDVGGDSVEVARSDHGSDRLLDGLNDAGAYVHETVLYRLVRPAGAGASVAAVVDGEVDALAFTSSLTVEHFLAVADERGVRDDLDRALGHVLVGAIGPPTAATADDHSLAVDVVAEASTFEALADGLVDALS